MENDKLEVLSIRKWLEDKLGEKNLWCASSIRTLLTKQMMEDICKAFTILPTQVKLKILLSIVYLPRSRIQEWQTTLERLLKIGVADNELSVAFLAEILQPYPSTGGLFTDLENLKNQDNRKMVEKLCCDLANEISLDTDKNAKELNLLPMECYYADRNVLKSMLPEQEPPISHFRLKRKTKAQIHREDLINEAYSKGCVARKSRYSAEVEIPVRMKMNPRKVSDTIPRKNARFSSHLA